MKTIADLHTHTIASGHAYATVTEMAQAAAKLGLYALGMTDHGPKMDGSAHIGYFHNLKVVPETIHGVRILRGCEANIMDAAGTLDLDGKCLKDLELVIASMHEVCLEPGESTRIWLNVLENPYVDVMGHSGNGHYPFQHDIVLRRAGELGKVVEINDSSFKVREGSVENCIKIALKCKEYGVKVVVNSDAHMTTKVGDHGVALKMLEEIGMPEELVINASVKNLKDYFRNRPGGRGMEL